MRRQREIRHVNTSVICLSLPTNWRWGPRQVVSRTHNPKHCTILNSLEVSILSGIMNKRCEVKWLHWAQWIWSNCYLLLLVRQMIPFSRTFSQLCHKHYVFPRNLLFSFVHTSGTPYVLPFGTCHFSVVKWGLSWPVNLGVGGGIIKMMEKLGRED